MLGAFGPETCGIVVPWPGIKPTTAVLAGEVLTTGPPDTPLILVDEALGGGSSHDSPASLSPSSVPHTIHSGPCYFLLPSLCNWDVHSLQSPLRHDPAGSPFCCLLPRAEFITPSSDLLWCLPVISIPVLPGWTHCWVRGLYSWEPVCLEGKIHIFVFLDSLAYGGAAADRRLNACGTHWPRFCLIFFPSHCSIFDSFLSLSVFFSIAFLKHNLHTQINLLKPTIHCIFSLFTELSNHHYRVLLGFSLTLQSVFTILPSMCPWWSPQIPPHIRSRTRTWTILLANMISDS